MQIAIVTDVHGNRPAFEAVIADAEAAGADEMWCLGDLVGYGAEPDACVALAERHCAVCLCGNHDLGVIGGLPLDDFSRGARIAAEWTQENISQDTRDFLLSLHPSAEARGYGLFHASPRDPVWEYVLSGLTAELCFDVSDYRVNFVGHSHVALSFHRPPGEPTVGSTRREGDELDLGEGNWLLNPGGAGQPRDGDPRAAWLLLDTQANVARWRRTEYDISAAQKAIRDARLPDSLAERLTYGQ